MIEFTYLQLEAVVAQGATAVVLRGNMHQTLRNDPLPVAIKMYTSLFVTDEDVRRFSKETALNIGLSHPNIVRFYGYSLISPLYMRDMKNLVVSVLYLLPFVWSLNTVNWVHLILF